MKNKKTTILMIVAIITLLTLIIGATYAYFQASGGTGTSANLRVTTYTTDVFNFEVGNDISIYADATSFASGKGNAVGSTFAKAILSANNKTNTATKYYYLYLNISKNTFNYTQDTNTPEILLTIKDGAGNEITSINDLTYKTVTDGKGATIKGFDITTGIGLITLFNYKEIIATPQKTDTWNVTVTFINYDKDQSKNAGKSFNAKLIAQQNGISDSVSDYCKNGDNLANCIISLGAPDIFGATKVYHHDENLVNGANDNSYRYAGGDKDMHPAYYSCKYNGNDVINSESETNKFLKGDCLSVTKVTINNKNKFLLVDKSVNKFIQDIKTVKWDIINNKCVTSDGNDVYDMDGLNINKSSCIGEAYKLNGNWVGGIKIEAAGAGEETLYSPADEATNTPAYYSCKYNGNNVVNAEGKTNKTLQGDCSTVYIASFVSQEEKFYDKSINKIKDTVSWDNVNSKCLTSSGEEVTQSPSGEVNETTCTGNAYLLDGLWMIGLTVEEVGAGEETLYSPASEGVKNFVCFGSTETPCPTDNLYRIIGVIDGKVKLIKYDYANSNLLGTDGDYNGPSTLGATYKGSLSKVDTYYWNNATQKNTWSESNLNKINLNTNFINNIGSTWANKIATTTWKVGGNTFDNIVKSVPSVAYQNEIVAPAENTTYDAKIGLMYVSDYGFAASPSAWTKNLFDYEGNDANGTSITTINWMYMGYYDWMISRRSDSSISAVIVTSGGTVSSHIVSINYGVRPSFNLSSSITYVSGSGSMTDPILIN